MSANPEPYNQVGSSSAQYPIALVYAHRPNVVFQRFEMQCGIKGIFSPETEFLASQLLNCFWKRVIARPEIPAGFGNHGRSERFPWAISESTFFSNSFSLPSAMSRLICSSHLSSFH